MEYDPVKNKIEAALGESVLARKMFFATMDRLFLRSRYVARELSQLSASGLKPREILDAGSGFGQYDFRMARLFPEAKVTGLDVKSHVVDSGNRFAKEAGVDNVAFAVGDLLDLGYEARFDLVLSVDVIEHIEDDRRVLANVARALKPGGLFVLTTPYWAGLEGVAPPAEFMVGEHVRPGYSREELRDKLAGAGLELSKFTITYGPTGGLAWHLLQRFPITWLSGRFWLAPLVAAYFGFAYPAAWVLMQMDMRTDNQDGRGILAVAKKS
jgi:2-polyprenyl-3-methyl-5-hydroxy-6-metoxy-1,4-benzoquinol methylase